MVGGHFDVLAIIGAVFYGATLRDAGVGRALEIWTNDFIRFDR